MYPSKSFPMKLKSIFTLLSILVLASLLLPACREEKKFRIGVSQCSEDDWRNRMNQEIMREAMFHDNAEVEIRSAHDSSEKQIEDIRYFADNGFDIIIAAPNEAEPLTPVVNEVMARGIPVVIFDRNVIGDNYTAYQGADNRAIGRQAADYMKSLASAPKTVIEIFGNPGSTPARDRNLGFSDNLGDMKIVASAPGNWNYDCALAVVDSMFALHPDVDAVFAHNDRMALAAADAAKCRGIHPKIIGIDAAPEIGMKAVADGKIDATFLYPTEGYELLRTALAILEGKPYKRVSMLPAASAVDRSNADILMLQNESLKEESTKIKDLKSQVDLYWNLHSIQSTFLYVTLAILTLLFIVLFLFLRAFWQKKRQQKLLESQNAELERQRDNEKILNDQLQEATRAKLVFFTNVSHDLRTPLTLIAEPVRQIAGASNLTPAQKNLMHIADKNVRILQRLINQVLDFRKYENGKIDLNLTEVDFRALVTEWVDAFRDVAHRRNITLSLECDTSAPGATLAIDVEKIERVFFNLISNAFKYTPDNGSITLTVNLSAERLDVAVADTGRGIAEEDLASIFDRFYQVDKVHPNGSGIGLSLAKAFVELHKGTLSVESVLGKGSVFSVSVPVTHVAEKAAAVSASISNNEVTAELSRVEPTVAPPSKEREPSDTEEDCRPLLLVIDDNADILAMITSLMQPKYKVITALNGADGLRLAAKYVPDLVICDVMMPVMDGLECCRRLKQELSTSHIPVLMLTACSMDEQRVQGYESGADGYVSKPFNTDVLLARCDNLIANRRRIRELWQSPVVGKATHAAAPQSAPLATSGPDIENDFYRRFLNIFNEKMSDPDINVDALASELGLGRSQFYRKIKALTNYSPVELMRKLRLREARHLIISTDRTVAEIAYSTGFSSPAYFTKCYREAYRETPSDTRALK